jgi:hypothetical protein
MAKNGYSPRKQEILSSFLLPSLEIPLSLTAKSVVFRTVKPWLLGPAVEVLLSLKARM